MLDPMQLLREAYDRVIESDMCFADCCEACAKLCAVMDYLEPIR